MIYSYKFLHNRIVCFSDSSGTIYKEATFEHPCDSLDTFTDIIDSVDDFIYPKEISIFPNPAKHHLNLVFNKNIEQYVDQYIIYHLNGTKVLQNEMPYDISTIDVNILKSGTYIIHFLKDELSIASGRFVKME